jgi:hypothetical protein
MWFEIVCFDALFVAAVRYQLTTLLMRLTKFCNIMDASVSWGQMKDRHLTELENELLWFAATAEAGDTFVYARSSEGRATSIRHLALRCCHHGLILMTQKRSPAGFEYIAVKRQTGEVF